MGPYNLSDTYGADEQKIDHWLDDEIVIKAKVYKDMRASLFEALRALSAFVITPISDRHESEVMKAIETMRHIRTLLAETDNV